MFFRDFLFANKSARCPYLILNALNPLIHECMKFFISRIFIQIQIYILKYFCVFAFACNVKSHAIVFLVVVVLVFFISTEIIETVRNPGSLILFCFSAKFKPFFKTLISCFSAKFKPFFKTLIPVFARTLLLKSNSASEQSTSQF